MAPLWSLFMAVPLAVLVFGSERGDDAEFLAGASVPSASSSTKNFLQETDRPNLLGVVNRHLDDGASARLRAANWALQMNVKNLYVKLDGGAWDLHCSEYVADTYRRLSSPQSYAVDNVLAPPNPPAALVDDHPVSPAALAELDALDALLPRLPQMVHLEELSLENFGLSTLTGWPRGGADDVRSLLFAALGRPGAPANPKRQRFDALVQALPRLSALRKLTLRFRDALAGDDDIKRLAAALAECPALEELDLRTNGGFLRQHTTVGLEAFAAVFPKMFSLKNLDLGDIGLPEDNGERNRRTTQQAEAAAALVRALARVPALETLRVGPGRRQEMSRTSLPVSGWLSHTFFLTALAETLPQMRALKVLDLSQAKLSGAAAKALALAFPEMNALEDLEFGCIELAPDAGESTEDVWKGLQALAEALPKMKALAKLGLRPRPRGIGVVVGRCARYRDRVIGFREIGLLGFRFDCLVRDLLSPANRWFPQEPTHHPHLQVHQADELEGVGGVLVRVDARRVLEFEQSIGMSIRAAIDAGGGL